MIKRKQKYVIIDVQGAPSTRVAISIIAGTIIDMPITFNSLKLSIAICPNTLLKLKNNWDDLGKVKFLLNKNLI